jgi:hypothetical protein
MDKNSNWEKIPKLLLVDYKHDLEKMINQCVTFAINNCADMYQLKMTETNQISQYDTTITPYIAIFNYKDKEKFNVPYAEMCIYWTDKSINKFVDKIEKRQKLNGKVTKKSTKKTKKSDRLETGRTFFRIAK